MAKRVFKEKRKLSRGPSAFRKWGDWDEGDVLIGEFVSEGVDRYGKPSWTFKVLDAQFKNKKDAKKLEGQNITLNSNGQLDAALEEVEPGTTIQVTYNGMAEMKGGPFKGKDAHLVDVAEMEGDEDEESEDDEENEDEEESDDEEDDEEDYDL